MASSNIAVSHADTGLVVAEVVRAERISPHFVRVGLGGDSLRDWRHLGYDQWFRLAVPTSAEARFDNLSDRFGMGGYLRYLTTPKATRPVIRNYTVRQWHADEAILDVDFVTHGDQGVAGPWAARLPIGDPVGLIDQGCGFVAARGTDDVLLVGDDSALPAVLGILRDLPPDARGSAIVEVADAADQQEAPRPDGVELRWVVRDADEVPGSAALAVLRSLPAPAPTVNAFIAGESGLATGGRRHLVGEGGVPKDRVTFCGYWRA